MMKKYLLKFTILLATLFPITSNCVRLGIVHAQESEIALLVRMQKGHEDIFKNDLVKDYWVMIEDFGDGYDLWYVKAKRIPETKAMVLRWRALSFVDVVEEDSAEPI